MQQDNPWDKEVKETITPTKLFLTDLSIKVRTDQFKFFKKLYKPTKNTKVLDVGVTADEVLKDSNIFERLYEYPQNITAATIEDVKKFQKLYPKVKAVKIEQNKKLPFKNDQFDVVISWARLEHTGNYDKQKFFLNELLRVGKRVFITTPYRGSFYEPHSGLLFVQWLPLGWFRTICRVAGREFWSKSSNLNPLYARDIVKMTLEKEVNVKIYKMFRFIPSHLIIYN